MGLEEWGSRKDKGEYDQTHYLHTCHNENQLCVIYANKIPNALN